MPHTQTHTHTHSLPLWQQLPACLSLSKCWSIVEAKLATAIVLLCCKSLARRMLHIDKRNKSFSLRRVQNVIYVDKCNPSCGLSGCWWRECLLWVAWSTQTKITNDWWWVVLKHLLMWVHMCEVNNWTWKLVNIDEWRMKLQSLEGVAMNIAYVGDWRFAIYFIRCKDWNPDPQTSVYDFTVCV